MTDIVNTCYCSFCGKSQNEVFHLITGPTVFICNECVLLCTHIIIDKKEVNGDYKMKTVVKVDPEIAKLFLDDRSIKAIRDSIGSVMLDSINHIPDIETVDYAKAARSLVDLYGEVCKLSVNPWKVAMEKYKGELDPNNQYKYDYMTESIYLTVENSKEENNES